MTAYPTAFDVAEGDVKLSATLVDVDVQSGRAVAIRRVCINDEEAIELKTGRFE
jgi:calcineurin-like phosphoesterase